MIAFLFKVVIYLPPLIPPIPPPAGGLGGAGFAPTILGPTILGPTILGPTAGLGVIPNFF